MRAHLQQFGADAWFSDDVRLRPRRSNTQFRQKPSTARTCAPR